MTEIMPFTFPTTGQAVRTLLVDGEPWFVAKDACDVLGIAKYRDAVAQLDDDERASMAVDTPGGPQRMTAVNEPGVYALMMISRSPRAKEFRRWVLHEVLPAIRQTGMYAIDGTPTRVESVINALAELAHREHVVPFAGRTLAFHRWHKTGRGVEAFVQLTIDLNLPAVESGTLSIAADRKALEGGEAA